MLDPIGWVTAGSGFQWGIGLFNVYDNFCWLILFVATFPFERVLRYASLDDVAIWGVLALILMDWHRIGKQLTFLIGFAIAAWAFRQLMVAVAEA